MCDLGITEMAMRRAYRFSVVKSCDSILPPNALRRDCNGKCIE